jgi:hypothetical protein
MKFGPRRPSFRKSWGARTSFKRRFAPRMPRGYGWLRNPRKAAYNRIYNRTTFSLLGRRKGTGGFSVIMMLLLIGLAMKGCGG